jgi:hypothetical protein
MNDAMILSIVIILILDLIEYGIGIMIRRTRIARN